VRKALESIRLIDFNGASGIAGWQLIWDVADINDEAGGICVFKKLY